jgi:hypothetical protein
VQPPEVRTLITIIPSEIMIVPYRSDEIGDAHYALICEECDDSEQVDADLKHRVFASNNRIADLANHRQSR